MSDKIEIRRAKRNDVPAIATMVGQHPGGEEAIDGAVVMEWLFTKGVWIASQGQTILGVAAYQTENLVSVTDVFHVASASAWELAGSPLLATIEKEAHTLMCEANILILPAPAPAACRTFLSQHGYQSQGIEALHRIWRDVLGQFSIDGSDLMVKRLRDRMVMVPL